MFKIIRLLFSLAVIVAAVLIIKKSKKMAYDNCRRFSFCYRLGTYVGASAREIFANILVTTRGI